MRRGVCCSIVMLVMSLEVLVCAAPEAVADTEYTVTFTGEVTAVSTGGTPAPSTTIASGDPVTVTVQYNESDWPSAAGGLVTHVGSRPFHVDIDGQAFASGGEGYLRPTYIEHSGTQQLRIRTVGDPSSGEQLVTPDFGITQISASFEILLRDSSLAFGATPPVYDMSLTYPTTGFGSGERSLKITVNGGGFGQQVAIECRLDSFQVDVPAYVTSGDEVQLLAPRARVNGRQLINFGDQLALGDDGTIVFRATARDSTDGSASSNVYEYDLDTGSTSLVLESHTTVDGRAIAEIVGGVDRTDNGAVYFMDRDLDRTPHTRVLRLEPDGSIVDIIATGAQLDGWTLQYIWYFSVSDGGGGEPYLALPASGSSTGGNGDEGKLLVLPADDGDFTGAIVLASGSNSPFSGMRVDLNRRGELIVCLNGNEPGLGSGGDSDLYRFTSIGEGITNTWNPVEILRVAGTDSIQGSLIGDFNTAAINDSGRLAFWVSSSDGFTLSELDAHYIAPSAFGLSLDADEDGGIAINDAGDVVFVGTLLSGGRGIFHLKLPDNTTPGEDVEAVAGEDGLVELVFDEVETGGETTVEVYEGEPAELPSEFTFEVGPSGGTPTFFDISTDAAFNGEIELAIKYDETLYADESLVRLLHFENDAWVDVTTSVDTANDIVHGVVTSLSPFALVQRKATIIVDIDVKPANSKNKINLRSRGNTRFVIFSDEDFDATEVDPETIQLSGAGVKMRKNGKFAIQERDVNCDGRVDLVVKVPTQDLKLCPGDTEVVLAAKTHDGQSITGVDEVVAKKKKGDDDDCDEDFEESEDDD